MDEGAEGASFIVKLANPTSDGNNEAEEAVGSAAVGRNMATDVASCCWDQLAMFNSDRDIASRTLERHQWDTSNMEAAMSCYDGRNQVDSTVSGLVQEL